ncbi:hypothetical protein ANOM_005936 [Aspergillus nomiae NRRL 13137]|uniref:Heterokaryon incompatibility domain-containing protein n=1 Tax=Aspergillus nomiae NRRL (strain ATCC 15546 / NRRL 13137 / CBS 260.88 / M93) TaxID=1509407 RepID=A0A0L1J3F0_ASPN3|nr:uncharacterized protein ANOM_005936 [Aspergillus nomiae NRRL 13137]KNG86284.1 hypothetical protein ANOM_005936 [Aspergillus nomiae NRRL 13137]
MESFKYEPLDLDGPAFRLVRLCHGYGSRIDCEIFQAWLYPEQSPISYEALSYTWGSTEIVRTVRMNGKRHGITHNLYLALQYLRFRDQDRILWVDGICIDQTNDKERGHQVRHMGDIYKQSERVIFWLGEPTDATDVILNSLRELQKESTEHASKMWELSDRRWVGLWSAVQSGYPDLQLQQRQGFKELLSRPWFKRVWILQEVANARAGLVCCGEASVSAHIFPVAPLLLNVCPRAHCQAVLDIMPGPSRSGTWWNMNRDLYTLLIKFCESQAGLPCDKIYALLGLSSDAQDTDMIRPDYEKSEHDLIQDVVRFLFDDHTYCTQKSYFPTLRKLVKNLGVLNGLFLQHHMWSSNLEDLETILDRRYFGIAKTDIEAAALASVQAIGNFRRGIPRTSDGVAMDATEIWDHLKSLVLLLQHRGYRIERAEELLLITLSKNSDRPHILNTLLQRRASEITITHKVWLAMSQKQFYPSQAGHTLFQQQGNEIRITNDVLIAAASNIVYGLELMQLLIQHGGNEIRVTEGVLIAAVSNKCYGLDLVQLLLQQRGNKVQITDAVLKRAGQNVLEQQPRADMLMKLLLKQNDSKNQITYRLIRYAGWNHREVRKLLCHVSIPQAFRGLLGLAGAAYLQGHRPTSTNETNQHSLQDNRQAILEDFSHLFYAEKKVAEAFNKYVAENYTQHNPNILDGRQAAIEALTPLFSTEGIVFEIHQLFVGGDYGLVHVKSVTPGQNDTAVMDMYRFEGLKIVEHWDVLQTMTAGVNPHPFF